MKCQILCEKCGAESEARTGDGSKYPGEHVKYTNGPARRHPFNRNGIGNCDYCDIRLPEGTQVVAMSIWSDHSCNKYTPWEHVFLDIPDPYLNE